MSDIIKNAFENIDPENEKFVGKNVDIVEDVYALMRAKGYTQKQFAKLLGKNESEISKWLSGVQNLTLRSITKMEVALGEDIILSASKARKKFEKINYVHINREATLNRKATTSTFKGKVVSSTFNTKIAV